MRLIDADEIDCRELEAVTMSGAQMVIDETPTVDAEPVVHAHWEDSPYGFPFCSNCKTTLDIRTRYCPFCGAKMYEVIADV